MARLGQLLGQRWLLALALLATAGPYVHLAAEPRAALRSLLAPAALLISASGAVALLKYATGRPAPGAFSAGTEGAPVMFQGGSSLSSGHVVNSTVAVYVLLLLATPIRRAPWRHHLRVRATAVAVTVGTMNGRCVVVLDFHWVSDAVLGLILAALLIALQQAISQWPVPDGRGADAPAGDQGSTAGGTHAQ